MVLLLCSCVFKLGYLEAKNGSGIIIFTGSKVNCVTPLGAERINAYLAIYTGVCGNWVPLFVFKDDCGH